MIVYADLTAQMFCHNVTFVDVDESHMDAHAIHMVVSRCLSK